MSAPLSERDGRFILPNEPVHTLEDKPPTTPRENPNSTPANHLTNKEK